MQREQWMEKLADRSEVSYLKNMQLNSFMYVYIKPLFYIWVWKEWEQTEHRVLEWVEDAANRRLEILQNKSFRQVKYLFW